VLERIADHKANRLDDLLPWVVADQLGLAQAAQSRELAQAA